MSETSGYVQVGHMLGGTGRLAAALAEARKKFEPITRSKAVRVTSKKTNTTYTFNYAPFEEIVAATRPALTENGLSVVQSASDGLLLSTLIHSSGESIGVTVPLLIPEGASNQEVGSALTYARRYGYSMLLCLTGDDDDDANVAEGNEVEQMPECSIANCNARARYTDDAGLPVCGTHRPNKPAPAPRNPANGKQATGEKLVAQERWRKAIQAAVEAKLIDSIYANPSAEYGNARKKLLGQTLEMPESWSEHLQLTSVTLEQWQTAADRLFIRAQEATA